MPYVLVSNATLYLFCPFQAARETGALQAAKNKLEKQVEELTWRLQLEKRMRVKIITSPFYLTLLETIFSIWLSK